MALVMSEWGLAGVEALKGQISVLVIVDVLSFSTAVDIAVSRGAVVFPTAEHGPDAEAMAARIGAVLAQRQRSVTVPSLSPASLLDVADGLKLVLPSPNGARLSLAGGALPVLAGSLRNAGAVAEVARKIAGAGAIGIIQRASAGPTAAFGLRSRICWARAPSSRRSGSIARPKRGSRATPIEPPVQSSAR